MNIDAPQKSPSPLHIYALRQEADRSSVMTNKLESQKWILVLPPELVPYREKIKVFSLPHPSNNTTKRRVQLVEFEGGGIYELRSREFSRGCPYNHNQDEVEDKYHYTSDGKTIKSTLIMDERDPRNGYVLEGGNFYYLSRFDITFTLIGFFYKDFKVRDEKDYIKNEEAPSVTVEKDNLFLRLRDFHDLVIDSHDLGWRNISLEAFKAALENIADPIDEAGDIYYKITVKGITQCLVRKIKQVLNSFPATIPIPSSLSPDMMESARITVAVNLFISLIPRPAYWHLIKYSEEGFEVEKAFQQYTEYIRHMGEIIKEKELLVHNAMKVASNNGLNVARRNNTAKKIVKKTTTPKKKVINRGVIDGFFKKAK